MDHPNIPKVAALRSDTPVLTGTRFQGPVVLSPKARKGFFIWSTEIQERSEVAARAAAMPLRKALSTVPGMRMYSPQRYRPRTSE